MKNSLFNLFFSFLIVIFAVIWVSDKLSVLVENDEYGYVETTEKGETESQKENKLKTLFFIPGDHLNMLASGESYIKISNSFYSFVVKEFCFENGTPPPEWV